MTFDTEKEVREFFRLPPDHPLSLVDELMDQWASAQSGSVGTGYPATCGTCRGARSSVQFDDPNDVIDDRQRAVVVKAVDGAMDSLTDTTTRAVLWMVYTNRRGPAVWRIGVTKGMGRREIRERWLGGLAEMRALLKRRALVV